MAHPVEDTDEYLIGAELKFARLLSELRDMTVIEDVNLIEAANRMDLKHEDTNRIMNQAVRMWRQACEGAEADKMLEDIRACLNDGDQSMAEMNFEELDKHMTAGKRPPSEWSKENK